MVMSLLELHFLRPAWLLALVPLIGLLWLLTRRRLGQGPWEQVCDSGLMPYILRGTGGQPRRGPLLLIAVTGLIAILALAGPTWDRLPQPLYQDSRALVIALDLSRAMDATDLEPSRLVRARYKIADVLAERREGVTGLVVYAGEAFTVTPLSTDTATIAAQLGVLTTDLMPLPGNRAERALTLARDLLRQAGHSHGDILLVTAGTDTQRLQPVAARLRNEGYRLSILGAGTQAGAPIPAEPGGFLRDRDGAIVIPRLEASALAALAATGGGTYQTLQPDDRDIEHLLAHFSAAARAEMINTGVDSELWLDRGPWLVLLLLPLALLAFRRGLIMGLTLIICLPLSQEAAAMDWERIWLNQNQRAERALAANEPERAADLFRDPEWRAVALYRAGDYDAVLDELAHIDSARSWYNRGNALARLGLYEQAIDAYNEALQRASEMEDARHNRDVLLELLQDTEPDAVAADPDQWRDRDPASHDPDAGEIADNGHDAGPPAGSDTDAGQLTRDSEGIAAADEPGAPASGDSERMASDEAAAEAQSAAVREHEYDDAGRVDTGETGLATDPDGLDTSPEQIDHALLARDADHHADEQWLRRVEDDPGALLRRKFLQQYRRQYSLQPYRLD